VPVAGESEGESGTASWSLALVSCSGRIGSSRVFRRMERVDGIVDVGEEISQIVECCAFIDVLGR